jgi:hypothetical protein
VQYFSTGPSRVDVEMLNDQMRPAGALRLRHAQVCCGSPASAAAAGFAPSLAMLRADHKAATAGHSNDRATLLVTLYDRRVQQLPGAQPAGPQQQQQQQQFCHYALLVSVPTCMRC